MKTPIADRISTNFTEGMRYVDLEYAVFPEDDYPKAFRYQSNGGPPACRMVLMAALRRNGYRCVGAYSGDRKVYKAAF